MSQADLEVAHRWVNAFNADGFDGVIVPYWHEDIELVDPPGLPGADRYIGKTAVRTRIESYIDEMGWDCQFRVEEFIDAGEEIVMVWRLLGRTPLGGVPLDAAFTFVLLFEDGKLRRVRQYITREEGLEAAGVSQ